MPEKCALSHGSGVLGPDPRDSYRFWSPHVENVCTVTQIRLGEGGGGGDTIGGGGGGVGEPRTGIIYDPGSRFAPPPPPPNGIPPPPSPSRICRTGIIYAYISLYTVNPGTERPRHLSRRLLLLSSAANYSIFHRDP